MKFMKIKIFIVAAILSISLSFEGKAFFSPPPGPTSPTIDVVSDVTFFLDTVTVNIQAVTAQAGAYMQTINQQAKATLSKYTGKFTGFMGGIFKKEEKQPLPGTKKIEESKKYDIYDKASIMEAVYELFFQYPVDCSRTDQEEYKMICSAYRDLATEFYQDSIIELYASTRELEKKFDEIEQSINELETTIREGKSGSEESDDENAAWKNLYNAYETMDSLLKIVQEIEAMRTQYIAVQAIGSGVVQPMLPVEDKEEQDAWNEEQNTIKTTSITSTKQTMRFAQVLMQQETLSSQKQEEDSSGAENTSITNENKQTTKYKSAVSFVPAQSNIETPYGDNRENLANVEHINKAHNLLMEAVEIHNRVKGLSTIQELYEEYDKAQKVHAKALETLRKSEQCAINYFDGMYEDSRKMWNGGLSEQELTDIDARKGISGWAVKAFNIAKAEDTGVVAEAEDFNEINVSTDGIDGSDLNQSDKLSSQINEKSGGFKSVEKADKVESETRKDDLLAWNIGSEASKMLAIDQAENGEHGKWGKIKKAYPVWKDIQVYYNQYIDGKYDSIIKRLNAVNMQEIILNVAEELNNLVADTEERQRNKDIISQIREDVPSEEEDDSIDIETLITEKRQKLYSLYQEKEQKLAEIDKQKEILVKEIDEVQAELNDLNVQRQDLEEQKRQAETILSGAEEKINNALSSISESEKLDQTVDDVDPVIEENRNKILEMEQSLIEINQKIDETTERLNKLQIKLEQEIPLSIQTTNDTYIEESNKIATEYDNKIKEQETAKEEFYEQINNLKISTSLAKQLNLEMIGLPEVINEAQQLVLDTKGVAEEIVKDTVDSLYAMGEELYNPKNHAQIMDIHKELMDKLKELPTKTMAEYSSKIESYNSHEAIIAALSSIYQKYIVEEACAYNYCKEPDVDYFVSNGGKQRDFRAPKSVPAEPLPSVREAVYFDYITYNNIPRSLLGKITAEDFLTNLTYAPEIWKYILRRPAYVEKEIDLETVISPSVDRLAGGGVFPCLYENMLVTSTGEKYRLYIPNASNSDELRQEKEVLEKIKEDGYQKCQGIEIAGNAKGIGRFFEVKNIAEDVSGMAEVKPLAEFKPSENMSELGHILEYKEGLKYNELAEKVFQRLLDINKDSDIELEQKDILFDTASLHQNQIGDFLKKIDYEQQSHQHKIETQLEVEKAKEDLYALFSKIGFAPAEDFDLSNEDDYTLATSTLMRYRNKLISSAASEIENLQDNENEVISEKIAKLNNLIKALQKDDDAYTVLSDQSKDDADLEEKIKSEKTNRQVMSKQKEEEKNSFEQQLLQMGDVYCSELAGNI